MAHLTQGVGRRLTPENYTGGLLIDEELLGGVSVVAGELPKYLSYALRHTTGEYLGRCEYTDLNDALSAINSVQREWAYEGAGGCGGSCGSSGGASCASQSPGCSGPGGSCGMCN